MTVESYRELLKAGPFPGRIDPWAEVGHYFQQIHAGMIAFCLEQIQDSLLALDLLASTQSSLQETNVWHFMRHRPKLSNWSYADAAAELGIDPGIPLYPDDHEPHAIYIWNSEAQLVTVLEVILPFTKLEGDRHFQYLMRREHLLWNGINVVEIDATRSENRLLNSWYTKNNAYHTAIFMPGESPRIVPSTFDEPLKRFALPLIRSVIAVDAQNAYEKAYRLNETGYAVSIDDRYTKNDLPYSDMIPDDQHAALLDSVTTWRARLESLRQA